MAEAVKIDQNPLLTFSANCSHNAPNNSFKFVKIDYFLVLRTRCDITQLFLYFFFVFIVLQIIQYPDSDDAYTQFF